MTRAERMKEIVKEHPDFGKGVGYKMCVVDEFHDIQELIQEADRQSYLYDTKYSEDYTLEDRLNRPKDFVKGAIKDLVDLLKRKAYRDGYIVGAKAHLPQWHNLQENPTDLPQCKEDEQIIFYVKEWVESIQKYRAHYCLGFYKKAFLNDDVKVFVEKSKGYENEHLPTTVLRWRVLEKWETE